MPREHARAISPVMGVALMLVIIVLLSGTTVVLFLGFTDSLNEPAPMFTQQGQVEISVENASITDQKLVLVHEAGGNVQAENLVVKFNTGNGTVEVEPSETGDLSDGAWSAGERLELDIDTDTVCTGADSLGVSVTYADGDQSHVLSTQTVPVTSEGFTIEDGAVVPNSGYQAEVTVLGTGFTYGAGGPNIDIRLDVAVGNASYDPWPGNVNNNGNPRSHTFTDQPAGAGIKVAATADEPGDYISPRTRWSNESNGWVYVLRDGDQPPNIAGFGDQDSASSYVGPYLDDDGNISLSDNEAIYLFELGNSQTGSSADFQDVVLLVTLQTERVTASVEETTTGESVIVCPTT
ncbi:type IV pilin [Haloferax sp. DFSO60]|uniref:type IV pilin n=1 Tax=Haloferax sp. DFSO60 TaxID=3388652 RepID=UPI00397D40E4